MALKSMSFKDISFDTGSGVYYKLADGLNRLRIVSEPVDVWTSFNREEKTAKKYLSWDFAQNDPDAKHRWAMWVIDRNDGKIKLAEFGALICKQIQGLANDPDYSFDIVPAYDIKITRSGSGLETEYVVAPSPATELTEDEKIRISALESVGEFMKKQPNVS